MLSEKTMQEDIEAGADLLYDFVETEYLKERAIPNKVELMKNARLNLGIGLKDSIDCVREMEQKYRKDLQDIGYFGKLKSAEDLGSKSKEEGILLA